MTAQPNARVLVVEDEPTILRWTCKALTDAGYTCESASHGDEGLRMARSAAFDLLIVDLGLPGRSGIGIIQGLRAESSTMPIIVMTAEADDERVVEALDSGADDYLVKPVAAPTLLARVRAALRRGGATSGHLLRAGSLVMDRMAHRAWLEPSGDAERAELLLTGREYALLEYLLLHQEAPVTRSELHEQVWGMRFDPGTNVVDATVSRVRAKLAVRIGAPELVAVRSVGYRLVVAT